MIPGEPRLAAPAGRRIRPHGARTAAAAPVGAGQSRRYRTGRTAPAEPARACRTAPALRHPTHHTLCPGGTAPRAAHLPEPVVPHRPRRPHCTGYTAAHPPPHCTGGTAPRAAQLPEPVVLRRPHRPSTAAQHQAGPHAGRDPALDVPPAGAPHFTGHTGPHRPFQQATQRRARPHAERAAHRRTALHRPHRTAPPLQTATQHRPGRHAIPALRWTLPSTGAQHFTDHAGLHRRCMAAQHRAGRHTAPALRWTGLPQAHSASPATPDRAALPTGNTRHRARPHADQAPRWRCLPQAHRASPAMPDCTALPLAAQHRVG
ncbi:hypothetical protein BJY22_003296 [Kribbella shirazensis]|uniref:Uncharacterized protein n=1 Tax=Kribbella shirazensis TaxID=1105143 RepID=A0A7X5VAC0_9ACTN|nr:hypothetical protein [Kribbella shirazensis]